MTRYAKLHGNGNDFLVLDLRGTPGEGEDHASEARALCRREESLGADGLLLVESSSRLNFRMRLFNRDGSEGEMCGNGARCIARYAWETGIAPAEMAFETLGGDVHARVDAPFVRLRLAEVDLGDATWERKASAGGQELAYSFLTVGVPHCVVFLEDLATRPREELFRLGRELRGRTDLFPRGTNVNFLAPEKEGLFLITYERGVEDLTRSCGTGSVAAAVTARRLGRCGDDVKVRNLGGINRVLLEDSGPDRVRPSLEGRTALVAWMEPTEEALV